MPDTWSEEQRRLAENESGAILRRQANAGKPLGILAWGELVPKLEGKCAISRIILRIVNVENDVEWRGRLTKVSSTEKTIFFESSELYMLLGGRWLPTGERSLCVEDSPKGTVAVLPSGCLFFMDGPFDCWIGIPGSILPAPKNKTMT